MASYYTDLMALNAGQSWSRTSGAGAVTTQPAFVVVHVALAEFRIEARAAIQSGHFTTTTGATYTRIGA